MDAGKKKKKKKKKKNELRLGAGIILNQELTYSRHWGKWAAGACQRPDLTKNPIDRLAFLSGAKRVFFYIYTTIPIPNPKDTGKTGDIII